MDTQAKIIKLATELLQMPWAVTETVEILDEYIKIIPVFGSDERWDWARYGSNIDDEILDKLEDVMNMSHYNKIISMVQYHKS